MGFCCVVGCANRTCKKTDRKPGVSFHRFPLDTELKNKWIEAIGRKNWKPSVHSHVCSEHFAEEDVNRTYASSVRLREAAVPSIVPRDARHQSNNEEEEEKRSDVETANGSEMASPLTTEYDLQNNNNPSDQLVENEAYGHMGIESPAPHPAYMEIAPPAPQPVYMGIEPPAPQPAYMEIAPPAPQPVYMGIAPPAPQPAYMGIAPPAPQPAYMGIAPPAPQPAYMGIAPPAPQPAYMGIVPQAPQPAYMEIVPPAPQPAYMGIVPPAPQPAYMGIAPPAPQPALVVEVVTTSPKPMTNDFSVQVEDLSSKKQIDDLTCHYKHLQWKLKKLKEKLDKKSRLIRMIKKRNKRLTGGLLSRKTLINQLKSENLSCEKYANILTNMNAVQKDLFESLLCKIKTTWSPEFREFARALNIVSPQAYRYVRQTFNSLPHPRTLRKWESSAKVNLESNSKKAVSGDLESLVENGIVLVLDGSETPFEVPLDEVQINEITI